MDDDIRTRWEELGDVLGLVASLTLLLFGGFVIPDKFHLRVIRRRKHVPIVQKGILGLADIDEGGLETGFEVLDAALKD